MERLTCNGFSARAETAGRLNAFGSSDLYFLRHTLNKRQETTRSQWQPFRGGVNRSCCS